MQMCGDHDLLAARSQCEADRNVVGVNISKVQDPGQPLSQQDTSWALQEQAFVNAITEAARGSSVGL